jgi:hypothetical protein
MQKQNIDYIDNMDCTHTAIRLTDGVDHMQKNCEFVFNEQVLAKHER